MPNTNFQTIHQFGAGISQVIRQATGRDPVHNIDMEHVTVAQNKRGYPVQSFMGNPLTFTGEQQGYLGSVLLEMFVRQNLNGYDYPWPAGGGVNLFNIDTCTRNAYITEYGVISASNQSMYSDIIPVVPGGSYSLHVMSGNTTVKRVHGYDSAGNWVEQIDFHSVSIGNPYTMNFVIPETVTGIRISIAMLDTDIQVQAGTFTSYSPYANICPIPSRNDVAVLIDRNGVREVYTSDFPAPGVYAGTFNMATGELTSTWAALPVSVLEWQRTTGSNTPRMYAAVPNMLNDVSHRFQIYTTHFRTITDTSVAVPDLPMYSIYALGGGSENVYVRVPDDMTVEQFEQEFADAMIVYPVNVPDISQLPKHVIPTAIGTNTVATDADLLEVTLYYLEDI